MNPATGRVPLYGANDGANVLPIADGDFLDFRPIVQATCAVIGIAGLAGGPWQEAGGWLKGNLAAMRPALETGEKDGAVHFPDGGLLWWRSGAARLAMRCPRGFRHRPSQADLQHVDLEWRGEAIAIDAGTFSYNTSGPLASALKPAAVHNTVVFDGEEPLRKAGRFLYLPWPRGEAAWSDGQREFSASHEGWARLGLRHERRITAPGREEFVIEDQVAGAGSHQLRLHWLLADLPYHLDVPGRRLVLETASGRYALSWSEGACSLVRADPESDRGWWAPHYLRAEPALSLAVEVEFSQSARVTTRFAPAS
jgi:hypothetical protein